MKTLISRYMTLIVLAFAIALIGAPSALASNLRDRVQVRFNQAIQVPGAVLQPGNYVFQLEGSLTNRHTVHIFKQYPNGTTKLVATVETDRVERSKATDRNVITTYKVPAGDPAVLDTWFMPGSLMGRQFVYGSQEAIQLARLNDATIPVSSHGQVQPTRGMESR